VLQSAVPVQNGCLNPGSSLATLWIQVSQDDLPPASIPSTMQSTQPAESQQTGMQPAEHYLLQEGGAVGKDDLLRLLEQAAAESLDNMKPRKKQS
jgi:hypothetical protein